MSFINGMLQVEKNLINSSFVISPFAGFALFLTYNTWLFSQFPPAQLARWRNL
jgi:hypothetical protein